jgi:hypothetical protein
MNQYFDKIPDDLFGLERTGEKPQLARIRFTPTKESAAFLNECQKLGYDLSTIINLALITFKPKTKPNGFTWEGIRSVL